MVGSYDGFDHPQSQAEQDSLDEFHRTLEKTCMTQPAPTELETSRFKARQDSGGDLRITLRDHYAAAALAGMLANGFILNKYNENGGYEYIKASFEIADDMLIERNKP